MLRLVALFKGRKNCVFLGLVVVDALLIKAQKSREHHRRAGGAENVFSAVYVDRHGVESRVLHLGCNKTAPYQPVKLKLIGGKALFYLLGHKEWVCRSYCLVGVLCLFLGLVDLGLFGEIFLSEALEYIFSAAAYSLGGNSQRVGSHIGYKTCGSHACYVYAFIELLRHRHGALCRHGELSRCLLLE